MNFEQARFNMIEQQIRPWEVLDPKVLDILSQLRREDFVPPEHRNLALADLQIPLGHGVSMMPPKLEARLVQELQLNPQDKVLEVGTGSGFTTALLASLCKHVYSVEISPELSETAKKHIADCNIQNVTLEVGDAARGWPEHAPYDAILVTGSLPILSQSFKDQLNPGGRLIAIVGQSPAQEVVRIERVADSSWSQTSLFETDIAPISNAESVSEFEF
ncbi:protein-L-isoaspartate O-methyltransferase [Pseudomonadota bacterium]